MNLPKKIAIYGAGGFGKEIRGMLDMQPEKFSFTGFFDDHIDVAEKITNDDYDDLLFCIADPIARRRVQSAWFLKSVPCDPLIAPDLAIHRTVNIGKGTIICPGVKMTVDVEVGEFVIVNLNSTIGHDVRIGDFCSLMPSVNISGNVKLGNAVFVGSGATILQGLSIGAGAIIGAGAVVTRDVPERATVIGVPAKQVE